MARERHRVYGANATGVTISEDYAHNFRMHSILGNFLVRSTGYYLEAGWHDLPWRTLDDEFVFLYCLSGRGYFEQQQRQYEIVRGDLLVCLPGEAHRYGAHKRDPWTIRWIHAIGSELPQWCERLGITAQEAVISGLEGASIANAYYQTLATLQSGISEAHLIDAAAYARVALAESARAAQSTRGDHQRWQAFLEFINEHLQEQLSLKEMAAAINYSVAQLNRLSHQHSGQSPVDFHLHQRMQRAADQLLIDDVPVKDIALRMGYDDPYYFSRVFKKVHGISPRTYRTRQA